MNERMRNEMTKEKDGIDEMHKDDGQDQSLYMRVHRLVKHETRQGCREGGAQGCHVRTTAIQTNGFGIG